MGDERSRREAEFHDRRYSGEHAARTTARKYYSVFAECRSAYLDKILDGVDGSRVLEYGCGPVDTPDGSLRPELPSSQ